MMPLKKQFMLISCLSLIASQAFAYTIYNQLDQSVQVKDREGSRGINVTMTPHSEAKCDPNAKGCYGNISFSVYATQAKDKVICTWDGNIDKGAGNYFVIKPVADKEATDPGACFVEYYHD